MRSALALGLTMLACGGQQPQPEIRPAFDEKECVRLYRASESDPTLFLQAPTTCQTAIESSVMNLLLNRLNDINTKYDFPTYLAQAYVTAAQEWGLQESEADIFNEKMTDLLEGKESGARSLPNSAETAHLNRQAICVVAKSEYGKTLETYKTHSQEKHRNIQRRLPRLATSNAYLDLWKEFNDGIEARVREAQEFECK
ncbi:hypothetical protein HYV86_00170 [Candidatus Woesearchaeota archaeon]|nr:hypothetical protein [Candidatus Woesearchaeota archaeon]